MTEEDIGQWQHMFQELIQEVKPWHKWTLRPDKDLLPDVLKPGWTQYQQKTFARFHCSSCSRSWASGRVLVVFHMQWSEKKAKGQVKMRAFAQRCNQCPDPPFATPEFTWDNISRILNNLIFRILKKCYKEGFKQMGEIPLVGDTSLEGPHDSGNCEACLLGFCAQNVLGQASKSLAPPLSPTSSKSTREPKATATCSNAPCSGSSSKVEKPQASKVNLQASNPTKDDLKVSCTSKPSTTPRLTIQQLSVVSSPAPSCVIQMPSPIDSSGAAHVANKNTISKTPKSLRSSSLYAPPTSSDAPPTSSDAPPTSSLYVKPTSSLYVPSTPSYVSKVSYISKPSTTPRLTIQQLSVVSSPAPSCVIQMPSPIHSSGAAHVANKNTISKTPKSLRASSLYAPPTSSDAPPTSSSWRPPANTTCQVERSSHIHPQSQSSCCKACCGACCGGCGACCGVCGACCEGCCKIILGCCACYSETIRLYCESCSKSPLCCLLFLILLLLLWYLL